MTIWIAVGLGAIALGIAIWALINTYTINTDEVSAVKNTAGEILYKTKKG